MTTKEMYEVLKIVTERIIPLEQRVKKLERERFWLTVISILFFTLCSMGLLDAVVLIFVGAIPVENYFV